MGLGSLNKEVINKFLLFVKRLSWLFKDLNRRLKFNWMEESIKSKGVGEVVPVKYSKELIALIIWVRTLSNDKILLYLILKISW